MGIPTAKRMQSANSSRFAVSAGNQSATSPFPMEAISNLYHILESHAPSYTSSLAEQRTLPFTSQRCSHGPAPPLLYLHHRKHQPPLPSFALTMQGGWLLLQGSTRALLHSAWCLLNSPLTSSSAPVHKPTISKLGSRERFLLSSLPTHW